MTKKMKRFKIACLIASLMSASLLVACNKIVPVDVTFINGQMTVDLSSIKKEYPQYILTIREFEVRRRSDCTDCLMWRIEGDKNSQALTLVTYGHVPAGMIEKVANRDLSTGDYAAGGVAWLHEKGGMAISVRFSGRFTIQ